MHCRSCGSYGCGMLTCTGALLSTLRPCKHATERSSRAMCAILAAPLQHTSMQPCHRSERDELSRLRIDIRALPACSAAARCSNPPKAGASPTALVGAWWLVWLSAAIAAAGCITRKGQDPQRLLCTPAAAVSL